jgi:hypothetical protein
LKFKMMIRGQEVVVDVDVVKGVVVLPSAVLYDLSGARLKWYLNECERANVENAAVLVKAEREAHAKSISVHVVVDPNGV